METYVKGSTIWSDECDALFEASAELVYHPSSEGVVYAILSHVWGPSEQSFQNLQVLQTLHSSPSGNPRSHASDKIRNFCIYAEAAGCELAWEDTCCIDKTSSAELSEAINSMYAWYANADVCFAFLEDVSVSGDPEIPDFTFRQSEWFTRGWTLQELIAPLDVVFLSASRTPLCSKCLSRSRPAGHRHRHRRPPVIGQASVDPGCHIRGRPACLHAAAREGHGAVSRPHENRVGPLSFGVHRGAAGSRAVD